MRVKGSHKPPCYEIERLQDETAALSFYENANPVLKPHYHEDDYGSGGIPSITELSKASKHELFILADKYCIDTAGSKTKEEVLFKIENALFDYEYDEYRLTLPYDERLEQRVKQGVSHWLAFAKKKEFDDLTNEARSRRDKLLADTDWTQLGDSPLNEDEREKYRQYRQALRDLTKLPGFPYTS